MAVRVRKALLVALVVLSCADVVRVSSSPVCRVNSVAESVLEVQDSVCLRNGGEAVGVQEGDEVSLQKAVSFVQDNSHDYVALLFYASWCPFSATFRSTVSVLSSLYPFIPHFAFEESVIRPSILSKYGVHGFPTLFLLNSTTRMRYQGSRTVGSLVTFYSDVTGLKPSPLDRSSLERIQRLSEQDAAEQENCPFSWARSPEKLLRQETYLALATAFVFLRLLYFSYPSLRTIAQLAWRYTINVRLRSVWEHPVSYLNRAIQLFSSLKEPCKRSNLQEGALNAKAWASKSLASVSFGDASTSRSAPVS